MKTIITLIFFSLFAQASYAQVNDIKKSFDQLTDMNRFLSFALIKGKAYNCSEYVYSERLKNYNKYTTKVSFKNQVINYYGSQKDLNYLEYDEYRRTSEETFGQVPHFGCDGIEWGVAYLDDSPYLQMANEVGHVGNSNLGPCYELKFRTNTSGKLLAVGIYDKKIIHALTCNLIKK